MRKRFTNLLNLAVCLGMIALLTAAFTHRPVRAQGKNAQDWPTANATPQRDAWIRIDFSISPQNMQNMKGFGVLRKVQLEGDSRQTALPAFHLLSAVRGGYGFKSMGYIADAAGNVLGIDSDTGGIFWKTRVSPAPASACSGVLSAGVANTTALTYSPNAGRGGGFGRRAGPSNLPADYPGRGKSGGMVGDADQGAPSLKYYGVGGATAAPPGATTARATPGAAPGGGGRGANTVTGGTSEPFPVNLPIPFPNVTIGGTSSGAGGGRGGGLGVLALSSDGNIHSLSQQNGYDTYIGPTKFLPPDSFAFGLVAIPSAQADAAGVAAAEAAAQAGAATPAGPGGGGGRGGPVALPILYAATSNACGGTAGVWALDLATPEKTVTSWKTNGGAVAGTAGPAIGSDGTLYVATADGDYSASAFSDSVVALQAKTLKMTDSFTPGKSAFVSSPVVMNHNGKDLIAAINKDGKMYLLDSASLGGSDHKTPLSVSAQFANIATALPGALASWQDSDNTRWVLASISGPLVSGSGLQAANGAVTNGAVVAFKIVDQGGKPSLQPGWVSRDIASPLPPIVVNGVVFTAGVGPQGKAVLYALDGATGREYLNSESVLTAAPKGELSEQFGTVYMQTADNTLWSFGFPQDKEDFGSK